MSADNVGSYRGRPIPAWLDLPNRGGRYAYVGVAVEDNDGDVWLRQLADDEVVISPGLIYRRQYVAD